MLRAQARSPEERMRTSTSGTGRHLLPYELGDLVGGQRSVQRDDSLRKTLGELPVSRVEGSPESRVFALDAILRPTGPSPGFRSLDQKEKCPVGKEVRGRAVELDHLVDAQPSGN